MRSTTTLGTIVPKPRVPPSTAWNRAATGMNGASTRRYSVRVSWLWPEVSSPPSGSASRKTASPARDDRTATGTSATR